MSFTIILIYLRREDPNDAVVMHPKYAEKRLEDLPDGRLVSLN